MTGQVSYTSKRWNKNEKIYSTYDTKAFIVLHILKVIYYTILGVYVNTLIALYSLYSLKEARSLDSELSKTKWNP